MQGSYDTDFEAPLWDTLLQFQNKCLNVNKTKKSEKKFEIFFFTCFPQVYIYHFMYTG